MFSNFAAFSILHKKNGGKSCDVLLFTANFRLVWAQDYKEKHKLDSKQISDSPFGAHLSFCQK